MNIPLIDRSNYLKGLLITARLDKELSSKEKEMLKTISEKLGFASDFFEETIRNLLTNKYIDSDPIVFSDKSIATSFLQDAISLACVNKLVTKDEIEWLKSVAFVNDLNSDLIEKQISQHQNIKGSFLNREFALFSII
ncbi:MAG: hypothetical protein ROY99_06485 [Ignavibacterium sp.]|jgi:hypothetical protein|nr:hypothetical protein [Ignavibacterium sp.]